MKMDTYIRKNHLIEGVISIILFIAIFSSSCVSGSKLRYFNDIDTMSAETTNPRENKLIVPFDRVNIEVFSIDEKTRQLFSGGVVEGDNSGYLVDKDGYIKFPLAGRVNVNGLTPEQAGLKLEEVLRTYVTEATVTIKFVESKVTIMGEVNAQGSFSFSQDKLNIYEALALGGGIAQYGNRKNIVLVRQKGNNIKRYKLDLSDSKISEKEYYYIEANDVIIVEPIKSASWFKFNSSGFMTIFSSLASIMSLYTFVLYFVRSY